MLQLFLCCFAALGLFAAEAIDLNLYNMGRLLGTAPINPAEAVLVGGVSLGSAHVGYRGDSQQWRTLLTIDVGDHLDQLNDAYRIELALRKAWVTSDLAIPPAWRVDFLGTSTTATDTSLSWNSSRFNWQETPGITIGSIAPLALRPHTTFDVTEVVQAAGFDTNERYLVFRVSAQTYSAVKTDGSLSDDLTLQGLTIFPDDAVTKVVVDQSQIRLAENNGARTCTVVLQVRTSGDVILTLASSDPSVANVE